MSKEVDERIVSMEFDNKNFEANVRESMSTIEKLKSALKFKGAEKGLQAVEKASNKVNFSGLNSAVDQIGVRFSAMQVMATTALANITNAAVNAGKQLVNSLTVQPITSGFQEYETQIGSIQTILSNTRWQNTSLDQVNSALDQLNDYADQTIYNFTEMTRNIGTFTAAGVGLEQSVSAIKGIANLAAVSGSSSQQASTAMYQLSQALAAGRVSLMDWNSVVNAGMGGKVFQDALIRTSEIMGTGAKQAIETYGTFRESLTKGQWLTTDVLTETLKQISGAYTEADLISQGYTKEQAAEIAALADDATKAATKVRTFSQLMDTTMEALGSGWTNTWEILIGDFDEATEFWSGISSVINDAVGQSADARNQMLQQWVDMGGRQNILDGLVAALDGLNNIITPIKEAFSEIFPPVTAQTLLDISTGFENLMVKFRDFSAGAAPVVKDVFTAIFSVIKAIGSVIGSVTTGIGEFFGVITGSGGDIGSIISQLAGFVTGAANAVTESGALTGVLTTLGNAFGNVISIITDLVTGAGSKLGSMFSGMGDIFGGVANIVVTAASNISSGLGEILSTADLGSIIDVFNSGMLATLIASVKGWFDSLTGGVEESTGGLIDSIKDMVGGISDNVTGVLDSVRGSLETWQTNIKTDILLKIAVAVVALVAAIAVLASIDPDRLTDALGAITVLFAELIGSMTLFTKLNTNMEQLTGVATMIAMAAAIAILAGAMKSLAELDMDGITRGMVGIAGLATIMTAVTKALSKGGDISKGAVQLILMAAAIKVLASVAIDLSVLDWEGLAKGLVGVGVLMAEMAGFSQLVKADGIIKATAAMVIMAAGLEILADVVQKFGSMSIETIAQGLITVAAAVAEFAGLMRIFPKGTTIIKSAAGIFILALALESLVPAMQGFAGLGIEGAAIAVGSIAGVMGTMSALMTIMSKMDVFKLGAAAGAIDQMSNVFNNLSNAINTMSQISVGGIVQSLAALTTGVGLMIGIMVIMSKLDVGDVASITITMPVLAASLGMLADAINKIGNMNIENAAASTIALVGAVGALAIGMQAVKGKLSSVASLMLVSVALVALAGAIVLISNTGIIGVATSFIALAGAMTIVGLATKILKPLIPSMFSLAGSIATFGGSLVILGVGTAAVGIGLGALMTSLAAGIAALVLIDPAKAGAGILVLAGALTVIGVAAKLLKPMIGSILSLSVSLLSFAVSAAAVSVSIAVLVSALTALGSIGQEGAKTVVTTLKELIIGITGMIPELITNLMESFKTIVLGLLDALVEIAPQLADGIFQILSQTIQSSLEYMPQIAGFFIDFLIQMLNTVRERLPELFPAVTGLIGDLIKMIMEALGQWQDTGNSIEVAVGIFTGMIGLVVLLNFIKGMIPGAMVGLLGLAAFVVEFGAVLTALGALQQLTGAASFINSAGDLLQSIGTAIGQFIGGLVGGFAEGATSTLPQVGTNLSQFAMNIMPFLIAMQMVDQKTIDGVTNLALAIAALAGANFVDAVTTFLSGGQDFGDLGAKLIPFGQAMVQFSSIVSGIDVDAINASAACGQALAALATSLPKEGGLAQAIFGETVDMGTFATQMVAFGMALRMYATAVSGVDFGPVQESAVAGQALSDLASTLPKEGGLAQAIFGETTDMDKFGAQMVAFGLALKLYAAAVAGLDTESIQNSVTAGQALSDLANALPNEGGLAEWIFGGSDLGSFGETLTQFGDALNEFSGSVAEVDTTQILAVTARIRSIKDLMADSVALDMTGLENLKRMGELSDAYVDFYNDASSIDTGSITSHINALNQIRDFLTGLTGLDLSGANSFVQSVTDISNIAMNGITSTFEVGSLEATGQTLMTTLAGGMRLGLGDCTQAARDVIQGVCDELGNPGSVDIPGAGTSVVNKFAEGIKNNIVTATGAVNQLMSSAIQGLQGHYNDFFQAGVNLAEGFASGIGTSAYKAKIEAAAMANAAANAAKAALDEHSPSKVMRRIGEYAGQGFVLGVGDFVAKSEKAGEKLAQGVIDGASLKSLYESFGDLEGVYKNLTDLSKKYDKQKKKDTKTTEEETEETSKFSEVLSTVADDVQKLIDRRNDLRAIDKLLSGTAKLSRGFVAELLNSSGKYAGAISEMTKLTTDQLNMLSAVYDESKLAENMEELANTLSESLQSVYDGYDRLGALQKLFSRGIKFGSGFISELIDSSGQYADALVGMADLTEEQLKRIEDAFNEQKTIDNMNNLIDTVSEMMMSIQDRYDRIDALNTILSNKNLNLSEEFIAELKDSSGEYADILTSMVDLTEEQIKQIEAIYNENIRLDNIEKVIDKISELEKEVLDLQNFDSRVNSILGKAGGTVSNVFANELRDIDGEFADFLDALEDASGAAITKVSDMFTLKKFFTNLKTLENAVNGNHGLREAFEKAETDIEGFAVAITRCGLDMEEVIDKITEFADKVSDGFNKIKVSSQTGLGEFMDNIKNNLIYAEEWATNLDKVIDVARGVSGGMDFINKVLEGGIDQYGRIIAEMANLSDEGIENIINAISGAYSSGASYGIGIANSYMDYSGRAFEDIGKALGIGLTSGITTGVSSTASNINHTINTMCSDIETTTKSYFGIHSPSKLMASIGKNIVAGLSNGITNARNWVIDAVSTINSYLSDVDTSVNDMTVKITPVIDYAEYDKKLAVLSSDYAAMLSPTTMNSLESVIRLSGQNGINDATKRLADAVDRLENKVASINPDNFGVTYQQINNSPTPLSTATIYRQTRNQISLAKNRNGKSFNN